MSSVLIYNLPETVRFPTFLFAVNFRSNLWDSKVDPYLERWRQRLHSRVLIKEINWLFLSVLHTTVWTYLFNVGVTSWVSGTWSWYCQTFICSGLGRRVLWSVSQLLIKFFTSSVGSWHVKSCRRMRCFVNIADFNLTIFWLVSWLICWLNPNAAYWITVSRYIRCSTQIFSILYCEAFHEHRLGYALFYSIEFSRVEVDLYDLRIFLDGFSGACIISGGILWHAGKREYPGTCEATLVDSTRLPWYWGFWLKQLIWACFRSCSQHLHIISDITPWND
jgi:hypothetical protein